MRQIQKPFSMGILANLQAFYLAILTGGLNFRCG